MSEVIGKALRYNEGKPKWSLVDFDALIPLVRALEYGMKKYGKDNWKKGLKEDELIDSIYRHTHALNKGELIDPESGVEHEGHLLANLMFYSHHKKNNLI